MANPPPAVPLEESNPSINIVIHGYPGVGKTVFGGGRGGADLIISCEKDGGVSARNNGGKGKIVRCKNWEQFLAAKAAWEDGYYGDPEWTLFDSWSSIQNHLADSILAREFGLQARGRKRDVPQLQDHQEIQNATKRIIGEICDAPRNVIFTAHTMSQVAQDGEDQMMPMLVGKDGAIAAFCCGLVTCIGYLRLINPKEDQDDEAVTKVTRRIYWQPRPPYVAKDWTGRLGRFTDNKTLADISTMMGAKKTAPPRKATVTRIADRRSASARSTTPTTNRSAAARRRNRAT